MSDRFFNVKVTHPNGYVATFFVPADDADDAARAMRKTIGEGNETIEVGGLLSEAEITYLKLQPAEVRQWLGA